MLKFLYSSQKFTWNFFCEDADSQEEARLFRWYKWTGVKYHNSLREQTCTKKFQRNWTSKWVLRTDLLILSVYRGLNRVCGDYRLPRSRNYQFLTSSKMFASSSLSQKFGRLIEPVFLNVYGAQESIPRNEFRQPMYPGGLYDIPIRTRFLAPIDCLKIPAQQRWREGDSHGLNNYKDTKP
jgi:hypothetical protein